MPDILTALTSLAVSVFHEITDAKPLVPDWFFRGFGSDPVLREVLRISLLVPPLVPDTHKEVLDLIVAEPEFADIAPHEGQLDPMLLHPGGGSRAPATMVIESLFSAALLQMYCLRLPNNEETFMRTVLEGFEELRRAIRGEQVHAYTVTGIARFSLPEATQVSTPWGIVRPVPAPPINAEQNFARINEANTNCLFAEPRLVPVKFDRAQSPETRFDTADLTPSRSRYLFPLACALASKENADPVAPLMTWSTLILPFQVGFGCSVPQQTPALKTDVNFGDRIAELEEWAHVVNQAHTPKVDIAARRFVSAVAHRMDRTDSLIDAVMVWENLFGTSREVTFRVSAALAKLLEKDVTRRRDLQKNLTKIYDNRSRLIHGATVDDSRVNKDCSVAIDVAVRALRDSYRKGREWLSLSSEERSNAILLE